MSLWLGNLLVWGSLVLGAAAAVTAYLPSLDMAALSIPPLTLNAPAGRDPADPSQPLVAPGETPVVLTPMLIERLRSAGVTRVRVKEFSLRRWEGKYLFALSLCGFIAGAILVRRATRAELTRQVDTEVGDNRPPEIMLREALNEIEQLVILARGGDNSTHEQLAAMVDAIQQVQRNHFDAFVRQGPRLMQQFGMAHFAQLMDRFAAAERLLNRAWSAAVDRVAYEVRDCLEQCHARLKDAVEAGTAGR